MPIGFSSDALFSNMKVPRVEQVVSEEREGEGITRYVYGSSLVASVKDSSIKYYHSDRIGSNRLITDSSGSVEEEFKSLPFGQEISNSGVRYSFATGKELDESNLYYFGARYYDQNLGMFTSVDPVASEPSYHYVRNNPLNLVDPSGELPEVIEITGPLVASPTLSPLLYNPVTLGVMAGAATLGIVALTMQDQADIWNQEYVELGPGPSSSGLFRTAQLDNLNIGVQKPVHISDAKTDQEVQDWTWDEVREDLSSTGTPNDPEEDPDFDPEGSRNSHQEEWPEQLAKKEDLNKEQTGRFHAEIEKRKLPGQKHLPKSELIEIIQEILK